MPAMRAASRPWRSPPATCTPRPRREFYAKMDAANVDLKAFTEDFYVKLTGAPPAAGARHAGLPEARDRRLVRDHHAADPRPQRLRRGARGDEPSGSCANSAPTCRCTSPPSIPTGRCSTCRRRPPATLTRARDIALKAGLHYVYTGNVHDTDGRHHLLPAAATTPLIVRDWYASTHYRADDRRPLPALRQRHRRPLRRVRPSLRQPPHPDCHAPGGPAMSSGWVCPGIAC